MNVSTDKLLIIHADDLGMCHSVNEAILMALGQKSISSASIMPTCSWFWEAAQAIKTSPHFDIGVHLTFTSEWQTYRWRPVSAQSYSAGLIDHSGAFHRDVKGIQASRETVRVEAESQIDLCLQSGIDLSHVDSHMFALFGSKYASTYLDAAKSHGLHCLFPDRLNGKPRSWNGTLPENVCIADLLYATQDLPADEWESFYVRLIDELKPGLSQILVHPGFDTSELRAIGGVDTAWGAKWRRRDYDVLVSQQFCEALDRNRVTVLSWRDLKRPNFENSGY